MTKIAFHTFGCKLNQVETEAVAEMFASRRYKVVQGEEADLFFVNTCAVTGKAEAKSRRYLIKLARAHPGQVIAMGCMSQARASELAEKADFRLILGTSERKDALRLLDECSRSRIYVADNPLGGFIPHRFHFFKSRAFVKIQDGCDNNCSFCIVPKLRGPSVSLDADSVVNQVREMLSGGICEVVLTGVDIGSYDDGEANLNRLLVRLTSIPELVRIRLSSVEPPGFTPELIETCTTNDKICPHFHLPLQSGSDKILRLMGRSYSAEEFLNITRQLSRKDAYVRIGADVIVGHPGEDEDCFRETYDLIAQSPITHIHIFPFSARPLTEFLPQDDKIPAQVKNERSAALRRLISEKNRRFLKSQIGHRKLVYFEENGRGFTDNYIRVVLREKNLQGFREVEIRQILEDGKTVMAKLIR